MNAIKYCHYRKTRKVSLPKIILTDPTFHFLPRFVQVGLRLRVVYSLLIKEELMNSGMKIGIALIVTFLTTGIGTDKAIAKKRDRLVTIQIGSAKYESRKQLMRRVHQLEMAVAELQEHLYQLEQTQRMGPATQTAFWTCYIETPFKGTITATEPTKTAAKAQVLKRCNRKTDNGLYCREKNVKCGQ